jgi:ABC-type sugar transport system ATPase subunit
MHGTARMAMAPHVELRSISKDYGGVHAVRDVSLRIDRGEVHGFVGENGAGKSTLSKIVAGAVAPSTGQMLVDGEPVRLRSPRHALAHGIAMIDQELALVPARSVLDNVFLGAEHRRLGRVDRRSQLRRYRSLLERTGFDLDPERLVGTLRVADQQKVEVLRALARDAELIIMDEPTAPLTQVEADQVYEVIRTLTERGVTVVYISHFLEEVIQVCDTITVMRDGRRVSTRPAREHTEASLVTEMLGRSLELTFPDRPRAPEAAAPALEVRGLSAAGRLADISFRIAPGEIVGMAGLIGSGRTEVLRTIVGVDPLDAGEVLVGGAPIPRPSPRAAIEAGLVLLPESRKDDGLVMTRSVAENTVLARLDVVSTAGCLRADRQRALVGRMIDELSIRTPSQSTAVSALSGGNQQKVLFARCLACEPRVLLVDEPTRGVDVGAKKAIYELIAGLAADGMAVLVVSSELEEVLGLAHRVLVMRRGRIAAEFAGDEARQDLVLAAAFGTAADAPTRTSDA